MTDGADLAERLTEICAELGAESPFVNESCRVGEHHVGGIVSGGRS
jgi:hypothetical protein